MAKFRFSLSSDVLTAKFAVLHANPEAQVTVESHHLKVMLPDEILDEPHPVRFTRQQVEFILSGLRTEHIVTHFEEDFRSVWQACVDAVKEEVGVHRCEDCGEYDFAHSCLCDSNVKDGGVEAYRTGRAPLWVDKDADEDVEEPEVYVCGYCEENFTDHCRNSLCTKYVEDMLTDVCSHCGKVFVEGVLCGCDEEREEVDEHPVRFTRQQVADICHMLCKTPATPIRQAVLNSICAVVAEEDLEHMAPKSVTLTQEQINLITRWCSKFLLDEFIEPIEAECLIDALEGKGGKS